MDNIIHNFEMFSLSFPATHFFSEAAHTIPFLLILPEIFCVVQTNNIFIPIPFWFTSIAAYDMHYSNLAFFIKKYILKIVPYQKIKSSHVFYALVVFHYMDVSWLI